MIDFASVGIDVTNAIGSGDEKKTTCPQCSHTRKKKTDRCLNVNVTDGVFHCWHCGFQGKVAEDKPFTSRPAAKLKPVEPRIAGINGAALEWFASRGITPAVLERNAVGVARVFMPQLGAEAGTVAFPYRKGGKVVNCKYRDREKHFRMETGGERTLYGYDDIAKATIFVEGEMDKLAVEVAGFQNCVSVPDGAPAPNSKNLESKFTYLGDEKLQAVEKWIIAVDNDAPGIRLRDELVRRFGEEKCLLVEWPEGCKDANDVLMQHGAAVLRELIEGARPMPIVGVFDAEAFGENFLRMYDEGIPRGVSTGWPSLNENYRVQLGRLLVVTGIPGHGKSEWVDALCMNLAVDQGWCTGFYSPENHPVHLHLQKLSEKYVGLPFNPGPHPRMSKAQANAAMAWINARFTWIMPEQPSLDEIIDKARALVARKGIRILVIDPWNEVEHNRPGGMTEAEYVSQSLMRLRRFARKHDLLLIVVAHPKVLEKKGDGTYPVPTPYDISGGAMWRNKAEDCIAVYSHDVTDPSGIVEIHVQKVKFKLFGRPGKVELKWDRICGRYSDVVNLYAAAKARRSSGEEAA